MRSNNLKIKTKIKCIPYKYINYNPTQRRRDCTILYFILQHNNSREGSDYRFIYYGVGIPNNNSNCDLNRV